MAFFKFRKGGDEPSGAPVQAESIDAMRTRAKHRLLGAAVLVLIGVVGFPILFDKQPRPISVDIPIEIPDRNKAKPLTIPEPVAAPTVHASAVASVPAPVVAAPTVAAGKVEQAAPVAAASKAVVKAEPKPVEKAAEKPAPAPAKVDDGSQAKALLEGKEPAKKADAAAGRFVVQVGAFADANRAREVRQKVEHAGLKPIHRWHRPRTGRRSVSGLAPLRPRPKPTRRQRKSKSLVCRQPCCRSKRTVSRRCPWLRSTGSYWRCCCCPCCWVHGAVWPLR